jgi:hypothetical protein
MVVSSRESGQYGGHVDGDGRTEVRTGHSAEEIIMTTLPVILGDTMLSNGSMAVLAGNNYKQTVHLPDGQGGTFAYTYYGFDQLQVAIVTPNGPAVTLNQSSGNLNFASPGDSPNQAVPDGNGQDQGNETQGGGTIAALQNGDIAVVTWGDYDHHYDLQILNSSLGVVTAPFVLANDITLNNNAVGNPSAVIASNASEFVVAWNTDDIQGLFYERFSLTGQAIGGPIEVKDPAAENNNNPGPNTNSNWSGSVSIDSQGNVIFGFGAEDVYHTGYYELFNSSGQLVTATSSQLIPTSGTGGTNLTVQNEEIAPQFVPLAGGGFLTAGYVPNGARASDGTYSSFGLYVQHVAADGTISTVSTTANVDPGGFQDPTFGYFGELSNGDLAFQEVGHAKADIFDPSTNTLVRDALDVPVGTYAGTGTGASYLSVPAAIATVTGAGLAALSVNSSNELTVACYAAGTLIRTDRGEIAVEALAIGDRVVTASGRARPIRWIGTRSYGGYFIMGRTDILPICFKAGALDDNVPHRDLWVSPHHAMYYEGVLIEAKDLLNGVSVVQAESIERVDYFHIELETHDVIIAEGALSESFIDDDCRGMFHNAHEYRVLYPDAPDGPVRFYAPRLERGYEVEAARRRIELRAGIRNIGDDRPVPLRGYVDLIAPRCIAGWAQNVDHPEAPVCVDIFADGVLIGRTLANQYRQDLAFGGLGSGRHGFVFTPAPGLKFTSGVIEVRRSFDGAALEFSGETGRRIAVSDNKPKRQRAATVTPHRKVKVHRRVA